MCYASVASVASVALLTTSYVRSNATLDTSSWAANIADCSCSFESGSDSEDSDAESDHSLPLNDSDDNADTDSGTHVDDGHPCDFDHEFPRRQLTTAEIQEAADLTNSYHNEASTNLAVTMFIATNTCAAITVQPRVMPRWSDVMPAAPSRLLRSMTLSARHGPFIEDLLAQYKLAELHVDAAELWSLVCYWFALSREDVSNALTGRRSGGRHGVQALLWVMEESECTAAWACGLVHDLRGYLTALREGRPDGPIHSVCDGDERKTSRGLNTDGIALLQSVCHCTDEDIVSMAAYDNFDTYTNRPPMVVLAPNLRSFYDNVGELVGKIEEEVQLGFLQGPFDTATHWPFNVRQTGSVLQGERFRRTGDGGGPHYTWNGQPLALNEWIPMDDSNLFPDLHLPTIFTMTMCTGIIMSLYEATGLDSMQAELLLTDWQSFYRSMVIRASWLHLTIMTILPTGCLCDLREYFGSRGAPTTACRLMDCLLFFWMCLILLLLERVTSWDVTADSGRGREVPSGSRAVLLLSADADATHRAQAAELIAGIDVHDESRGWDRHPGVRKWRQDRYNVAKAAGLSRQECINQSLPVSLSGFIDDSYDTTVRCLFLLVLSALLRMVELTGIVLSASKVQRARAGVRATVTLLRDPPTLIAHILWRWATGVAVSLGREIHLDTKKIFDTQKRVDAVCRQATALETLAAKRITRLVDSSKLLALIGVCMFMIMIAEHLRSLLNSPIACTRVKTRTRVVGRRRSGRPDPLVPYTVTASENIQQLTSYLQQRRQSGYAFFPRVLTAESVRNWPTVHVMNDSAGAAMVNGVIDEADNSFRGGACWIYTPAASETLWSIHRWDKGTAEAPGVLRLHCSTVTEMAQANSSLEAILQMFPGHLVIEVLDNKAATDCFRSLGCRSPVLQNQLTLRSDLLGSLGTNQLVVTCWSCREEGTLADFGSKAEMDLLSQGLAQRGLPPLARQPFARAYPRF